MAAAVTAGKKVAVVVGLGKGGIGDACAKRFSDEGYMVAMLARRAEKLAELEKSIPNTKAFPCDASDPEQIKTTVAAIESTLGPIDVLIYNAGAGTFKPLLELTPEEFESNWKVNAFGLFNFAQALVPGMTARGSGVIGVTGATASYRGMPFTPAFASAKFAQRALVQSMARDLIPKGIHVFTVIIDGQVGTTGQLAAQGADKVMDPAHIAETYWYATNQPRTAWGHEFQLALPADYKSAVTV